MAFNEQEKQIILWGKQNGKTAEDIELAISKLRAGITPTQPQQPEPQKNSTVKDLAIGAAKGAGSTVKNTGDALADNASTLAFGPFAGSLFKEKIDSLVQPIKDRLQAAFGLTDENLEPNNTTQKVGKYAEVAAELATPFVATRLARLAPGIIKATSETVPAQTRKAVDLAKKAIKPENNPAQAAAQIAQGKPKDLPSVATALETIDTKGVKTYEELLGRIKGKVPQLSQAVDTELSKDTTAYPLAKLAVTQATRSGNKVTTDYVSRALDDLAQMYKAIGDDAAHADIQEIAAHAKKNGLTRKEVNDISRVYGQEFGEKAFAKTGDPLTSVNAQAYENTRKGLKGVARQGLGGKEAQALDHRLSSLYDTQKLVQRNVDAVAKLRQRVQERGLLEKAGYYVSKYADIITGGSLRGFVGGILPRGAGYKTMNALDIEDALRKNLDVIERALAQNTDKGLLDILKQADPPFKKSGPAKPSR